MTNKAVFLSSLPGSGKSFLANKLHKKAIEDGLTSKILSTDDFFMKDGKYEWIGAFISLAHKYNQGLFYRELFLGTNLIIVDNTNLAAWQLYPYVDACVKNDYEWEIVSPKSKWANDPVECAAKNTHGVSLAVIEKMNKERESVKDMEKDLRNKFPKKN